MKRSWTESLQTPSAHAGRPDVGEREALHFRAIDMRGFRRADGLFEVEGTLTDSKPFDFELASVRRVIPAHQPLHDMGVRIVFDAQMTVLDVRTFSASVPYAACPEAALALRKLMGVCMAAGWSKEVRARLGGAKSCIHLVDLLIQLATTAFQAMTVVRQHQPPPLDDEGRPMKINTCHAYSAEGELVKIHWPQWYRQRPR